MLGKKIYRILLLVAVFCMSITSFAYSATLIYVPCDDRPVCLSNTADTLRACRL